MLMSRSRWAAAAVVVVVAGLLLGLVLARAGSGGSPTRVVATSTEVPITALSVRDSTLVNQDGVPVRLLGFNHSGTEYACIEGWGIFDEPGGAVTRMPPSTVTAMAEWTGANTVRVPLNEQCWLGLGVDPAYGGVNYQDAIRDYVRLLRDHGFVVVLDLHRSAPGEARSSAQEQMPNRDHSPQFWREVAAAYGNDTSVVFDLFNEPWPFSEPSSDRAWECWRDGGCQLPSQNGDQSYVAAGMAELIATIRATGARNVIAVGGIYWAEVLDRWLEFRPADPLHNLVASFHNYAHNRHCVDERCYDTVLASVAATVPLLAGEVGPDTKGRPDMTGVCPQDSLAHTGFSDRILDWLDAQGASYMLWSWNAWGDCWSLVTDDYGTPTRIWGEQGRARLARNAE
jgi:endoglucanase